ncbi:MAG: amidophosphoribosyltransferase [Lachnospiraceae bacterium]|nr:amidophosphoribosyltransferase [Lachnospiraceae bacterium]
MGGIFGVVSKQECVFDLFFGIDYHSHLGTRRGGMAVYGPDGFNRAIHNIENSPFRTKFDRDFSEMKGKMGIGCISDLEPQPLLVRSHLGTYAITTVGKITNKDKLIAEAFERDNLHFLEMSGGTINSVELVAALINRGDTIAEGIKYAQSVIEGSMTILLLTGEGLYAARDRLGRTQLVIGKKKDAYCASFESFAYLNLGYRDYKELGPGEIVYITPDGIEVMNPPGTEMKICTFLWVYYGYPTSAYEGVSVEKMRYACGEKMAIRDNVTADIVAGVPDSGTPHAIGYANRSGIPFARPFIKYTPTWPRSFMPTNQSQRNLIAKMKLIPVDALIKNKKLLLIDDSIVRGTQLGETTEFLYESGAKEVHIRPACPPILHGCKYLNFSRSTSEMDLITRRVIAEREGWDNEGYSVNAIPDGKKPACHCGRIPDVKEQQKTLAEYADPENGKYKDMVEEIRKHLNFTSLSFNRIDDMCDAVGIDKCKLCTYCWNGKE